MPLAQQIADTQCLSRWLHERTNDKKFPGGDRVRTGLAILQLTQDLIDGIVVLLSANMAGPAFSLARPLLEGYVRGFWLLHFATDDQVIDFNSGRCPSFHALVAAIPMSADSGGAWIHANVSKNLSSFHDLTHGGSEHVRRRVTEGTIEPRYPERELLNLLRLGNEIGIRIGIELMVRLQDEEGLSQLEERAAVLRSDL